MAASAEVSFPSGPWVLVVGMHRSGTSALTGALARLGLELPVPDDLVTGRYDNPAHYESRALTAVAEAALAALGGSWSAPPPLASGWERSPALDGLVPRAAAAARRAFGPGGPHVWKDPRLCLLLPWWRAMLPPPVPAVLVWRHPLAVARSLRARQGFPLSLGLALWQRYNTAALAALTGEPAYVVRYEDVVAHPEESLGGVARWLGTAGAPVDDGETALRGAAATIAGQPAPPTAPELPEALVRTASTLERLGGPLGALATGVAEGEPQWVPDVIEQRRQYEELYARYMRYIRLRRRLPLLGGLGRRRR